MKRLLSLIAIGVLSCVLLLGYNSVNGNNIPTVPSTSDALKTTKIGGFIVDYQGHQYKKLTDEKVINAEIGISQTDVWEKVNPEDKTKWYTPSLDSEKEISKNITFVWLYRMPNEEVPRF